MKTLEEIRIRADDYRLRLEQMPPEERQINDIGLERDKALIRAALAEIWPPYPKPDVGKRKNYSEGYVQGASDALESFDRNAEEMLK